MRIPPVAALGEHVLQHIRAVGEDPVDPAVEELAHLVGVVDRPHVDGASGRVRSAHQAAGRDGQPAAAVRDLQRGHLAAGEPVGEAAARQEAEQHDVERRRRRGHPPRVSLRNSRSRRRLNEPTRSRSQASRSATNSASAAAAPSDFRSTLKRASGNSSKSWARVGTCSRPPDQRAANLLERQVRDRALLVGDPVQDAVVERQQHPVGGDVDVGLEVVVAQRDGMLERRQGVLQALDLGVVGARLDVRTRARRQAWPTQWPPRPPPQPRCAVCTRRGSAARHHDRVTSRYGSAVLPRVRRRDGHPVARRRRGQQLPRPGTGCSCAGPTSAAWSRRSRDWHRHAGQHTQPMPRITADMTAPPVGKATGPSVDRNALQLTRFRERARCEIASEASVRRRGAGRGSRG